MAYKKSQPKTLHPDREAKLEKIRETVEHKLKSLRGDNKLKQKQFLTQLNLLQYNTRGRLTENYQ